MAQIGSGSYLFLNRDTCSAWQRAKTVLALANSDVSGMTGSLAGLIAMVQGKTNLHVTNVNFRDNEFPPTMRAWGSMIDQLNGAGTADSLMNTAKGTGMLAAVDSIFTTLDSTLSATTAADTLSAAYP